MSNEKLPRGSFISHSKLGFYLGGGCCLKMLEAREVMVDALFGFSSIVVALYDLGYGS